VLFVGGILTYFVLASEPDTGLAVALVLATVGLCLTLRLQSGRNVAPRA